MIHLPRKLTDPPPEGAGLTMPEHMLFIELCERLFEQGYELDNQGNGDLVAVPIEPCQHGRMYWDGGHWQCYACPERKPPEEVAT